MNRSTDPILTKVFRPSLLAWRANYLAAKAASANTPKPPPPPAPKVSTRH
jgi:hypothetical protein